MITHKKGVFVKTTNILSAVLFLSSRRCVFMSFLTLLPLPLLVYAC